MISPLNAERLQAAGLRWSPAPGDRFTLRSDQLEDQVFTISDMVVEAHRYETGTVLGFNGTTEWALDSVRQEDALWLPREDQLRDLLGRTFRSLARSTDGRFQVLVELVGQPERVFTADAAEDAYAEALLALVATAVDPVG
ncbi:pilus assembly protein CpaE [Cellulomonas endophytica]|uniref:pilus assembly protein CpaE n=1 Tax=Cellulomonas endophytica TaxID=2494735 RepID=UPI001012B438|nr:pilus assembly protein CpaE [Cellulomonas endophytica]